MSSLPSKIFFGVSCVTSSGTIWYVHNRQIEDRALLHQGIVKDLERQQMKKTQNIKRLHEQQELTKAYQQALQPKA